MCAPSVLSFKLVTKRAIILALHLLVCVFLYLTPPFVVTPVFGLQNSLRLGASLSPVTLHRPLLLVAHLLSCHFGLLLLLHLAPLVLLLLLPSCSVSFFLALFDLRLFPLPLLWTQVVQPSA